LAVIPNFIDLSSSTAKIDTLLLISTHAAITGLWFILVASVGMKVLPYFKDKSIGKWMNGVVGTVMLYFSFMLLTYEVKQS
jgi:threonine/homoserine/homoserine lactone efflux protein